VNQPLERDALRAIQDIIAREKGTPLDREGVRELQAVLARLSEGGAPPQRCYSDREATILFADLRGFSAISAHYPVEVVLGELNRCFGVMADLVKRHYGTVDKFMGDSIMALFHGDPGVPRDHARRAVLCAVEMQLAMQGLREGQRAGRLPELYLGIGISTGSVMAGLIGSDAYHAYTVIGEEVNLAARIEALSLRGQVLMSEATYAHVKEFAHVGEPMEVYVKGRVERMRVREVLGIPPLGKVVPRQDARKSPRVAVSIPLEYWLLDGKTVGTHAGQGTVRDISYGGLLAELDTGLAQYAELKLAFDLPCLGARARDVYARAVSVREQQGRLLVGMEFTSLSAEVEEQIRLAVQMLLQEERRSP
jgi:adenylate cyclase